jgi:hypothetical protein
MTVDTKVTKKFIFLLPKQKYFALALQVKQKVQGVYDFAQVNCKQIIKLSTNSLQALNHNTIYINCCQCLSESWRGVEYS